MGYVAAAHSTGSVAQSAKNRSLAERVRRDNSFDALRVVGALMVIVGHGIVLTGAGDAPQLFGIPIHTLGVYIFFAISGYLITGSWLTSPSPGGFLRKRVLRIFPALIAIVVLTVLVVGPVFSTLKNAEYFADPLTGHYWLTALTFAQYDLPGVFLENPKTAVNGSLWSIGVEFSCYVAVVVLGLFAMRRLVRMTALLVGFVVVIVGAALLADAYDWGRPIQAAAQSIVFFAVAALLRVTLPQAVYRMNVAVAGAGLLVVLAWLVPMVSLFAAWLVLPYVVVSIGRTSIPVLRRAARFGDISYGLYLWAYLVQQCVIVLVGIIPLSLNLALVIAVTGLLALASWHGVEKHAMKLKDFRVGLGRRPPSNAVATR
jgi:peptidoglycan/LPS O-acetylase OafA/YrhL